jgi:Rab-like protein 2
VTRKEFKFASKHNLPFFFVSSADGTNIVKVFQTAIGEALKYKQSGGDALSEMLDLLSDPKKVCYFISYLSEGSVLTIVF